MNNQPKKFKLIITGEIRPGWAKLPKWVMNNTNLPTNAMMVLAALLGRENGSVCWPSHKRIAEDTRLSVPTVKRSLIILRDAGLVSWKQRTDEKTGQQTNLYKLHLDDFLTFGSAETPVKEAHTEPPLAHTDLTPRSDRANPPLPVSYKQEQVNKNKLTINSAPKKRTRKKRATPLPPDWEPNPKHYELAAQKNVDINLEAEKFKDYATAHGKTYKDWDAAFRSWLRSPYCQPANKNPRAGASYDELAAFANQTTNPTPTRLLGG